MRKQDNGLMIANLRVHFPSNLRVPEVYTFMLLSKLPSDQSMNSDLTENCIVCTCMKKQIRISRLTVPHSCNGMLDFLVQISIRSFLREQTMED